MVWESALRERSRRSISFAQLHTTEILRGDESFASGAASRFLSTSGIAELTVVHAPDVIAPAL